MLESYKETWYVLTLVDITETDNLRGTGKTRNQQRNFETLQQCIGMLTQPWSLGPPVRKTFAAVHGRFKDIGVTFGERHDFTQELVADLNMWTWRFGIEREDVFGRNGEELANILQDIPIISGLDENCVLDPPVFSFRDLDRNILLIQENVK
jgi:hypothetical protein